VKHYSHLTDDDTARLFCIPPAAFDRSAEKTLLQYALGGTMYIPAVKSGTLDMLLLTKYPSLTSLVLCLEDAIGPHQSEQAMGNLAALFSGLGDAVQKNATLLSRLPLIFIRVKTREELEALLANPRVLRFCCGFVLPKYAPESGRRALALIDAAGRASGTRLYALPLIETARVIARETRVAELSAIRASFAGF
jgi:citrate lyase beta subunit